MANSTPSPPGIPPRSGFSFSIIGLLGMTTVAAVCVFVMVYAREAWILFVVLTAPPLVRTLVAAFRARAMGDPIPPGEAILFTFASMGVLTLAAVSSAVTFYGICSAVLYGSGTAGTKSELNW